MDKLRQETAGRIAALMKSTRTQEHRSLQLCVPSKDGDVLLRETRDPDELDQVFSLVYQVYVEEMEIVSAEALPTNQAEAKQKFDNFDFAPSTRHLVAVQNNRVVGCLRLVDEIDGAVPIDRNGFSLDGERAPGRKIRECGKLMIQPSHRGTRICMEFLKLAFLICCTVDHVYTAYLSCEPRLEQLYAVINATRIGEFVNAEFGRLYSVMRIDSVGTWPEQLQAKRQPRAEVSCRAG